MSKIGENEMSKQETDFSRRQILGQTVCFMLRRSVLAGIIAVLMGASLVFTGSASAHNIDLAKAKELVRRYAQAVRRESDSRDLYISSTWNCVNAFPNHNHIVRCVIQHQNARDKNAGVYTCKETMELYMTPHRPAESYLIYARHTSVSNCGKGRFYDTPLG